MISFKLLIIYSFKEYLDKNVSISTQRISNQFDVSIVIVLLIGIIIMIIGAILNKINLIEKYELNLLNLSKIIKINI